MSVFRRVGHSFAVASVPPALSHISLGVCTQFETHGVRGQLLWGWGLWLTPDVCRGLRSDDFIGGKGSWLMSSLSPPEPEFRWPGV